MDGTEGKKDALEHKAGQSLPAGQETPEDQAKTYTEDEIEEIKAKAAQDARVAAGRDAKSLELREQSLKEGEEAVEAAKAEVAEIQEQIDQAELEAARGDPAKLRELQAKKSYKTLLADLEGKKKELRKEREDFERDKAEHAAAIEAAQEDTLEMKIFELAVEQDLNPQDIRDAMTELKLTTVDQAVVVAKRLSAKPKAIEPKKPDSLLTSGSKGTQEGKTARQIYAEGFREKKK